MFFKAPWCKPCTPVLEQVEGIIPRDRLEIVNLAEEAGKREAARLLVHTTPTLIAFDGDVPLRTMAGSTVARQLRAFLRANGTGERMSRV